MVSINSNSAATSALRALQATSRAMEQSQTRISTGYRVNGAKDNASAWTLSKVLSAEIEGSTALESGIASAAAQADVTLASLESIQDVFGTLTGVLNDRKAGTIDTAAANLRITQIQNQLKTIVANAKYNGSNWLLAAADTTVAIGKDSAGAALSLSIELTDYKVDTATTGALADVLGAFALSDSGTVVTADDLLAKVATGQTNLTKALSAFASVSKGLSDQGEALGRIADIKRKAISSLVDADLDEESARLASLQVRQQLAVTALQIANQSSQTILRLFQ